MRRTSVLPVLVALALVAGCGGEESGSASTSQTSPSTSESPSPSPSSTAPDPSSNTTTGTLGNEIPWPTGPFKAWSTATLPEALSGWRVEPYMKGDAKFRTYFPPNANSLSEGVIVTKVTVELPLPGPAGAVLGHTYCARINDRDSCTVPLDGGSVDMNVGADVPRSAAFALGNSLYAQFR